MQHGSQTHAAVDTLGNLFPLTVTAAGAQERAEVGALLAKAQAVGVPAPVSANAGANTFTFNRDEYLS
ncbi:hypothetical protein [Alienimonas sp. DA493]|uniref:hypothetical protein n=1 Tax=Alienimonas sp. DA493 TaxID=3373605 RepID=UPI0037540509